MNFLGITSEETKGEKAKGVVLPVPYESTVTFGGGTSKGPDAIIAASAEVELYDEELGCEPYHVGVTTLAPLDLSGVRPDDLAGKITPTVSEILKNGKWPLILGGEHSITSPVVKAVHSAYPDLTVVQLDAHADLRSEYMGSSMNHACVMARVWEICPAVQIGIRNISKEGAEAVLRNEYPIIYARDTAVDDSWMERALAGVKTANVYVTLDVDVFDASVLPATGTPEPGGMDWYQVTRFLRLLNEKKNVVGMDIVELAPIEGLHACDFLVAKLAYKCIAYAMSK